MKQEEESEIWDSTSTHDASQESSTDALFQGRNESDILKHAKEEEKQYRIAFLDQVSKSNTLNIVLGIGIAIITIPSYLFYTYTTEVKKIDTFTKNILIPYSEFKQANRDMATLYIKNKKLEAENKKMTSAVEESLSKLKAWNETAYAITELLNNDINTTK